MVGDGSHRSISSQLCIVGEDQEVPEWVLQCIVAGKRNLHVLYYQTDYSDVITPDHD